MKKIYKYKVSNLPTGLNEVDIYINGVKASTATVLIRENCENGIYLKYLDRYGRYRFFLFNNLWRGSFSVRKIGTRANFSGVNIQQQDRVVGYESNRNITAVADIVTQKEIDVLSDIYTSPRVYLKIGNTDTIKDWLLVEVSGDGLYRLGKLKLTKVTLTITLPRHYAVAEI